MLYPVKIEFKDYPNGSWIDWSQYLVEAPTTNQRVESENEGEAGVIVFDSASVTFRYEPGNPVYDAFSIDLTSKQRYVFRISILKSDKTYVQRMEGMADFSSIEWGENEPTISFEIVDKLSALGILSAELSRTEHVMDSRVLQQQPTTDHMYYDLPVVSPSQEMSISARTQPGDILPLTTPVVFPGEILIDPRSFLNNEDPVYYVVLTSYIDQGTGVNFLTVYPAIEPRTEDYILIEIGSGGNKYLSKELYGIDINNVAGGVLVNLKGVETIQALYNQAWPGETINKVPSNLNFALPPEYAIRMTDENPLGDTPLDALISIVNSVRPTGGGVQSGSYFYINKAGNPVIHAKNNISSGTTRTLGSTRVISRIKKYFWDKLVDGAKITVESWVADPETGEYLQGTGLKTLQPTGLTGFIKPKNEVTKKILAPLQNPPIDTQELLDVCAAGEADNILSFYGKRRSVFSLELNLDDNTIQWELIDNLTLNNVQYFFTAIETDPIRRTVSLEAIETEGHEFDFKQIVVGLSESNSSGYSSGGGSSSGTGNVTKILFPYSFIQPLILTGDTLAIKNLTMDSGDILAQRSGTTAQESRIYNTYTDAINNEFVSLGFKNNSNVFTIESEKNGTGTVRDIAIRGCKVGIGTTTPVQLTEVRGYTGSAGAPASSGTTPTGVMRIGTNFNNILDIGAYDSTPYGVWLQAYDRTNLANKYPLILNPNGGNVGVGMASPTTRLEVSGTSGSGIIKITPGTGLLSDSGYLNVNGRGFFGFDGNGYAVVQSGSGKGIKFNVNNDTFGSGTAMTILFGGNVGIGTASPSAKLNVIGDIQINETFALKLANANYSSSTYLYADATGSERNFGIKWTASGTPVFKILYNGNVGIATGTPGEKLDVNGNIRLNGYFGSANYVSQLTGLRITSAGSGDFRYIYTDELHAKAFIADLEQALAGAQIICKSVAKVAGNYTVPQKGFSSRLIVESFAGFETAAVFQDHDYVRLRQFSRTSGSLDIADAWGNVVLDTTYGSSGFDAATKTQAYTFSRLQNDPGSASGTIKEGTLALDYGVSGNGFIESNAIDGAWAANSPYTQIVTWSTIPGNNTIHNRTGKLTGLTDADFGGVGGALPADFGTYINGTAFIKGNIFVKATNQLALQNTSIMIGNISGAAFNSIKIAQTGTTATSGIFLYDNSGNELLKFALDGNRHIANWNFTKDHFYKGDSSTALVLNSSANNFINQATGVGFEVYNPSAPKVFLGNWAGNHLDWNITNSNKLTVTGEIIGSVITGGVIQTDVSGSYPSIVINEGDSNTIKFYSAADKVLIMEPEFFAEAAGVSIGEGYLHSYLEAKSAHFDYDLISIYDGTSGLGVKQDILQAGTLTIEDTGENTSLDFNCDGTISSVADIKFNPAGKYILPTNNFDIYLGSANKKFLALNAAELLVDTLVAQNVMATIGGRIIVAPSNSLNLDCHTDHTYISVNYNNLNNGDIIYLEGMGYTEFMLITSAVYVIDGKYRYNVQRDLVGTGAIGWWAGQGIVSTGQTGGGFIDIYSIRGVKSASAAGPTIVGNVRNSATYNDWNEAWAIGNLGGLYGQSSGTFGVGLGKYANSSSFMVITPANGIQFKKRASGSDTTTAQWAADGTITIGNTTGAHTLIDANGIKLKSGNNIRLQLNNDGSGLLGNGGIQWNTSGSVSIAGVLYVGNAAYDINNNSTTINGSKITTGTINTSHLNFSVVQPGNVIASINASNEGMTINTNKLTLSGLLQVGGAAADINNNITTINGSKITTGTITTGQLSFTPVQNSSVVASINASAEGITINANRLNLTGVLAVGGAAADVNGNSTTINGGKITANTITTDKLNFNVVGSNNIVGTINASTEGLTINTTKLNLNGVLTVGSAASDINNGTTTINGSKITAGSVIASVSMTSASLQTSPSNGNNSLLAGSGLTFYNNGNLTGGVVNANGELIIYGSDSTTIGTSNAEVLIFANNFKWGTQTIATQDWVSSRGYSTQTNSFRIENLGPNNPTGGVDGDVLKNSYNGSVYIKLSGTWCQIA